jgi:hypothetical protein
LPGRAKCWCNEPKEKKQSFCNECTETIKLLRGTRADKAADALYAYNKRKDKENE